MDTAKMIFTNVRIFVLLEVIAAFRRGCQRKPGPVWVVGQFDAVVAIPQGGIAK
jgi:hypothetical protein